MIWPIRATQLVAGEGGPMAAERLLVSVNEIDEFVTDAFIVDGNISHH
jgi:hypothetical protein